MIGDPAVIRTLQAAVPAEAHANIQYRAWSRLLKFMGADKTAKKVKEFGDATHKFLKMATDQLLFLSGDSPALPSFNISPITEPNPNTITQLFTEALAMEMKICAAYEQAIPVCVTALDDETRNIYEHFVKWHHDIVRWLEKQLRLIADLGEPAYLAEKL
jgi:bacterioferritin